MIERRCNGCTLCCKLLPVGELMKAANTRCKYQRVGKGCRVYQSATYPNSCKLWSCVWLADTTADLPRPDHARYVVDQFLDFIELEHHSGERLRIDVIQVWVEPRHPDAHRDPKLRAYLADRCERFGQAVLVRFDERTGIVLFPPWMNDTDEWIEHAQGCVGPEHTVRQIYRK